MDKILIFDIFIAYILDLLIGDPYWLPHPIRAIGHLILKLERLLRWLVEAISSKHAVNKGKIERITGGMLTILVVGIVFFAVFFILEATKTIHTSLFHIINIYFIYSSFATRCLADEAKRVYRELSKNNLVEARKKVAMLVGRETDKLDEKGVIRAVIETTAENTVDGVIAPILFAIVGSLFGVAAPLVYAFKATSTLDSMVGYMNDKYINFGKVSAKLDDLLNYIPARLSGIIIPLAALFCGKDGVRSLRIMLRDRRNHKSPNCAYPEAAVAGALGIKVGGNNIYFGGIVEKPTIGDSIKQLEPRDIIDTIKIMIVSSAIVMLIGMAMLITIEKFTEGGFIVEG